MMELVKVKNRSYTRYEELLLRREEVQKEANTQMLNYTARFGKLIQAVFEKKLECIKKKKIIGFYQAAKNKGESIHQDTLNSYIKREMEEYYMQLEKIVNENRAVSGRSPISSTDVIKIKKIYKKLAKQLHPDINPKVMFYDKLRELWDMIQVAYTCNNLKDIEEAEVLVAKALEQLDLGTIEVDIPNIDEKIADLEAEIERIRTTDPYTYYKLLNDSDACKEKDNELNEELKEYLEYEKELDKMIEELINGGLTIQCQMKL